MDKRVIIVLVLVILIVAGVGAALLLLNRQPVSVPTPTPVATPIVQTQDLPTLTAQAPTSLNTAAPGNIDIFLDTKGTTIDGFQFIADLGGTAIPTIPDADPLVEGVQVLPDAISDFTVSTNNVTEQDGVQVIRFAMIIPETSTGFSSTSPVKVASIPISSGTGGSVSLTFNQQNSRVRLTSGGEDVLVDAKSATFPVTAQSASTATDSGSLVAQQSTNLPTPLATASSSPSSSTSPFCLASCFTDSDCAAGFVCEADRCVNPACPTSQTCSCGAGTVTQTSITPTPLALATATPIPTSTPTPAPIAQASPSGETEELPVSGAMEYTLIMIGAGLLLLGGGVYLSGAKETA